MIFRGGNVFYNGGFQKLDVRIQDGLIREIRDHISSETGETVKDISGRRLLPGLIDVHTHGRAGEDFTYASPEGICRAAADYCAQGVTSLLATTMTMEEEFSRQMVSRISRAMEADYQGSRILGINLEGPFLGRDKKGCHDERYLRPVDIDWFAQLDECARGRIRMVDLDPRSPESLSFIRRYGGEKIISIAHSSAGYDLACQAADAGAWHVTHLFNAMNSLHHREPGILGMVYDKKVYAELITDGLHVHPSVIRMMFAMIPEKICLVSDSLSAAGQPEGTYELGGLQVYVKEGRACLADGTLACSTISVYEGMLRCMEFGVPEEQAILAATWQPACSIRMEDKIGAIRQGLYADLLVTDQEYHLEEVYVGGKLLHHGRTDRVSQ